MKILKIRVFHYLEYHSVAVNQITMGLNLCKKELNIYNANSRIGLDKGIGKRTCKNTSIIDYFLMSSKLFSLVKEFEIQDCDPLLSDVHNPTHITLQSSVTPNINDSNTSQHPTKTQWLDNKRNELVCQYSSQQSRSANHNYK
jgi:hypothetical protein